MREKNSSLIYRVIQVVYIKLLFQHIYGWLCIKFAGVMSCEYVFETIYYDVTIFVFFLFLLFLLKFLKCQCLETKRPYVFVFICNIFEELAVLFSKKVSSLNRKQSSMSNLYQIMLNSFVVTVPLMHSSDTQCKLIFVSK